MRRIHYSLVLSILYLTVSFGQNSKTYKVNTIAFYNLENLFDTENDPITFDDDRTPDGKDHWTEEIYQDKLKNMAIVALRRERMYRNVFKDDVIDNVMIEELDLAIEVAEAVSYTHLRAHET